MRARLRFVLVLVVCASAGAYFVNHVAAAGMLPANDVYAYSFPRFFSAAEGVRAGWKGLFWTPLQNCGQPVFALSETGLLFPPHWLFLLPDGDVALRAVIVVDHVIAGAGMYLLARILGASAPAAICGALVLQLGTLLPTFSTGALPHLGAYACLPLALAATERLLRRAGARRAVQLALVLALQWLAGSPQIWFLTAQLIGLRLLAAMAWTPAARRLPTVAWVVVALALAPALAGVQVLPEVEAAQASLRSGSLEGQEANPLGLLKRDEVDRELLLRGVNHRAIVPGLVPLAFAALALPDRRRAAMFYAVVGVTYGVLAFGPATPLFALYLRLPGAAMFRFASRMLWVTGFCFAVLTALGIEAVGRGRHRWMALGLLVVGFATAEIVVPGHLFPVEWAVAATAALALLVTSRVPAGWRPLPVCVAVVAVLVVMPGLLPRALLPALPPYDARRPVFDTLRARMSPQERLYVVNRRAWVHDFSLISKTPSLLRFPAPEDYEPLLSERYARFSMRMRTGRPLLTRNDAIYMPELGPGYSRRLLDLTATRYVVVDVNDVDPLEHLDPPLASPSTVGDTVVLENPSAFPRAFYVPQIEVVSDAGAVLDRLATGGDDLHRLALVEPPWSGSTGTASPASGAVRFVVDDPEHVELTVDAAAAGFLVLADQYDRGWSAAVDGRPATIARANYAFRLVAVPAGFSRVTFVYRPRSLVAGGTITLLALVAAAVAVGTRRSRRRPSGGDAAAAAPSSPVTHAGTGTSASFP